MLHRELPSAASRPTAHSKLPVFTSISPVIASGAQRRGGRRRHRSSRLSDLQQVRCPHSACRSTDIRGGAASNSSQASGYGVALHGLSPIVWVRSCPAPQAPRNPRQNPRGRFSLHPSPVDRRGGGQNQRPAASRAGVSGPDPGGDTTTSLRSPDGPEPVGTATIVPRVAIGGPGQCACWYGASRHAVNGAGP